MEDKTLELMVSCVSLRYIAAYDLRNKQLLKLENAEV